MKPWLKRKALGWRMGMATPQAGLSGAAAWKAHTLGHGPRPVHVLVACDGASYTSDQQFAPMTRHLKALRREFGHVLHFRPLDAVLKDKAPDFAGYEAVFFKFTFRTPLAQAHEIARTLRRRADASGTALVYFDGDDDQCIPWPGVLQAVDLYVKKHAFADRSAYERGYAGRSNLTDYAARTFGFDFSQDHVPQIGALPAHDLVKIKVGWNIGLDDKIHALSKSLGTPPDMARRDVDVMCRASNGQPGSLLYAVREPANAAIQRLGDRFKVLAPTAPVPQDEYYGEMLRSKMCVCPFGFGELCWRDFEAALCGSLILKPDMAHVETAPQLFVPGETYVPLKWDYSDLEEKVAHYAARPQELERITRAARQVVLESLTERWFLDRYRAVVVQALEPQRVAAAAPASALPG
ncbi:MAG TPA: glycosyltransferase [Ramlibacter sp.]|uniref:glycosyltransferase n=1 Tax=Ramlibacter sp. TaxID=1917967 RepID=UPI002D49C694|nr:glycosyltransferase [Ramlibacter sp.]HZY17611.1 glycosyltransferase [Ramlibacter sp.]